jgi:hypothetical protein
MAKQIVYTRHTISVMLAAYNVIKQANKEVCIDAGITPPFQHYFLKFEMYFKLNPTVETATITELNSFFNK